MSSLNLVSLFGWAVLIVITLNTAIGFFTELRAVRSMEALQALSNVTTRVRRDGEIRAVPATELVPGDVVAQFERAMANLTAILAEAGANLVGGCCGTEPDDIRAMAEALRGMRPAARAVVEFPTGRAPSVKPGPEPVAPPPTPPDHGTGSTRYQRPYAALYCPERRSPAHHRQPARQAELDLRLEQRCWNLGRQ